MKAFDKLVQKVLPKAQGKATRVSGHCAPGCGSGVWVSNAQSSDGSVKALCC
ncbi:MAG TPA: hypothetical protein H9902_06715 [Candidatus Stackebrandtia faecavium]|nr:hypothetical protein [Candidatus Stackebrandtia faecavium]